MSDKLKQQISVVPTFVDGEGARAAKLNSLASQLSGALDTVEVTLGDIHNSNHPYSTSSTTSLSRPTLLRTSLNAVTGGVDRWADIANLARLIGPGSNLNPRILPITQSVTEVIPTGLHQFTLRYKPTSAFSWDRTDFSDNTVFASVSPVGSADLVASAGDWYVDSNGTVYCYTASNGGTVTYDTNPTEYAGGEASQGATFNVIPDINQVENGTACTVTGPDSQGRYSITLPTLTHQQSNYEGTTATLGTSDAAHAVQLVLPSVLTDNFISGETIPCGFLYLRNYTSGETYETARYIYNTTSTLYASDVNLDTAIAAGDKFYVITVGNDITTAIDDLRVKLSQHSHNREFGEQPINVADLDGVFANAGDSGIYVPSLNASNYFPQYMHRDGYDDTDANANDRNVMRGHFVMGRSGTTTPGQYYSTSGTEASKSIYFAGTTGSRIYQQSGGDLRLSAAGTSPLIELVDDTEVEGNLTVEGDLYVDELHAQGNSNIDLNDPLHILDTSGLRPAITTLGTFDVIPIFFNWLMATQTSGGTGVINLTALNSSFNSTNYGILDYQLRLGIDNSGPAAIVSHGGDDSFSGLYWLGSGPISSNSDWAYNFGSVIRDDGAGDFEALVYFTGGSWTASFVAARALIWAYKL